MLGLFALTSLVFAGEPPILISPTNGSTVTTSSLNWQAPSYQLYSSNPYRVQVDDDSGFASINKDYYTKNTYYTPTLNYGTWYWRVKAKDSSGTWSDWSNTWAFTLASSTPSPGVTSTPTSTPTPTTSPTSLPSTSSFTISGSPSQINADQSFNVSVNLSLPNNPSTSFYLKGAFKKSGGSNYFGLTKVSGNWVKNGSSYSSQYQITTDSSGNWSDNLEVKPDSEDSGFTGTGDYIFKVGRYTSTGSGPTWSNEETIKIIGAAQESDPTETISDTSLSPSSTISPSIKSIVTSSQIKSSGKTEYKVASIAGVTATATPSVTPSTEVKSQKQTNLPLIIGILLIISGLGLFFFIYLRNKKLK